MYKECSKELKNVLFCGQLAEYRYYDMHQVIGAALHNFSKETSSNINEAI
jgi:UDP-galactopyranose mutase